ncbi:MAG TPA: hypothetical protein P5181_06025 [Dermatophilaceae bacterium]|nr:hypothetical protein [Dermatophilaceae bacterium]
MRGAAWSVPAIVAASAVPAHAASIACVWRRYTLDWTNYRNTASNPRWVDSAGGSELIGAVPPSTGTSPTVSVTLTRSGDVNTTSAAASYGDGVVKSPNATVTDWLAISYGGSTTGAQSQTVQFSFGGARVRNVSFRITDVDRATGWNDVIQLSSGGVATSGSTNLAGLGTAGPVTVITSNDYSPGAAAATLTATWAAERTTGVSFTYSQSSINSSWAWVLVSDISFEACL